MCRKHSWLTRLRHLAALLFLGLMLLPVHAEIPEELVWHYMSGGEAPSPDEYFKLDHKNELFSTRSYKVYSTDDPGDAYRGKLAPSTYQLAVSNLIADVQTRAKHPPTNSEDWCAQLIATSYRDNAETFFRSIAQCVKAPVRPIYSSNVALVGVGLGFYNPYPGHPLAEGEVVVGMSFLFKNFQQFSPKTTYANILCEYFDLLIFAALRPDGSFQLLQYSPPLILKYE